MRVELVPIEGLPEFGPDDELARILLPSLRASGVAEGDVVVVTSKIVSKTEGRLVPGTDRVEAVAAETARVVARRGDLLIAETHHGFVCANAGVDASNLDEGVLALLPEDPDRSAQTLREALMTGLALEGLGVLITDTFGRAWRTGLVNVAIGCAGLPAEIDLRGRADHHGRALEATIVAYADEIAAASGLVMAKDARVPVAIVRGLIPPAAPDGRATDLIRPSEEDLFRESPLEALRAPRAVPSFAPGEVPRAWLVDAIAIAASDDAPLPAGLRFSVVTSSLGKARLASSVPGIPPGAGVFVVVEADADAGPADVGAVAERLRLALGAMGVAVTRSRSAHAPDGLGPACVVACGLIPEGGAPAPRPPFDPASITSWD
ncbi:MAG: coenzyme F420-0:L-glutamate ligase [Actinomycetota bacterium]